MCLEMLDAGFVLFEGAEGLRAKPRLAVLSFAVKVVPSAWRQEEQRKL